MAPAVLSSSARCCKSTQPWLTHPVWFINQTRDSPVLIRSILLPTITAIRVLAVPKRPANRSRSRSTVPPRQVDHLVVQLALAATIPTPTHRWGLTLRKWLATAPKCHLLMPLRRHVHGSQTQMVLVGIRVGH